ncbi:hypothetical protein [Candidatus Cardinium hertigii]|uniref:hypothetical protein n=1 Tax=Candidatus Cardinium hertigii TaxID=247481 RepID=UPI003D7EF1E8
MSVNNSFFVLWFFFSSTHLSYGHHLAKSYNPHSIRPIDRAYVLYARKSWRDIPLNTQQNSPCFVPGKEISKVLVEAVKAGLLVPYQDDTLTAVMDKRQFLKNLQIESGNSASQNTPNEFYPSEMALLRLVEHILFDKVTARQVYDIESIQLIVPGKNHPPTYLDHTIATFKYKDVVSYFNTLPFESVCWYNRSNAAENLNWIDAFTLRLFSSTILKVDDSDSLLDSEESYVDLEEWLSEY